MEIFRKYLEDAKYPATWIKDAPMEEVLSKPGVKRLYTLQWCLSKFDGAIEKYLAVQDDMLEAALWEVVTKMLMICTDCKKDRDVFEGNGKVTDQIEFWKKIFHIVHLAQLNEQPQDAKPETVHDIDERLKPCDPVNLIPMELKIASCDLMDNTNLLVIEKQQEIGNELELLKAEWNLKTKPVNSMGLSLNGNGSEGSSNPDSKQEVLQESIANFCGVYASKLQWLVDQTHRDQSSPQPGPSHDNGLEAVASRLSSELAQVQSIHENLLKMRDEYMQFMRQKTKNLRASLENGENKLKELRMVVSELDDLNEQ